jgi:hypothetical protein
MSLLDEIRNRANQPTVSPRMDVLQQPPTTAIPSDEDSDEITTSSNSQASSVSEVKRLSELLAHYPEIAQRVPVRLEVLIKSELDSLCQSEKVTIETLLEAFYITCKDKETVMRQVIKEAKKRLKSRKDAGNIRSSLTKLNNLTKSKKY